MIAELPIVSALTIVLLAGAAFAAGLIDAIAGGGGLVTVPALLAAGLPPHLALGTNKGQSVFGSIAALITFARRGALDRRLLPWTFPAGLAGSLAGAAAVLALPPTVLRPVILVMLPMAAAAVLIKRPVGDGTPTPHPILRAVGLALLLGAYDGFFGPGTGTFLIVGFVWLHHMTLVGASANAKVVNFASNLAAVAIFATRGVIIWRIALPMAGAQLVGGWVGAHLAVKGGERVIRGAVVLVVLGLVVKMALDLVRS